jgi:hypothetical protein
VQAIEQARFVDLIVESMGMTAKELTQRAKFNEALLEIGMKKGLAKPGATVGEVLTEKDVLKAKLIATTIKGGNQTNHRGAKVRILLLCRDDTEH